jgi:hypothetical protein
MMLYKIKRSKYLESEQDWFSIVSTILASNKSINASKKSLAYTKLSFFKNFTDFTLEVSVIRFENTLYVTGVNKNAQLELSAML